MKSKKGSVVSGPAIFAKFREDEILAEMGRLLFAVLNIFASNGYRIYLFDSLPKKNVDDTKPYLNLIDSIENLTRVDKVPENTANLIYLFDKQDKGCARKPWRKKMQVRYDIFASYRRAIIDGTQPVMLPYPMHPLHYGDGLQARLEQARQYQKKMRAFFSGDTVGYKKNRIRFPRAKLTRTEIVNRIITDLEHNVMRVAEDAEFTSMLEGSFTRKFVLVENENFRINPKQWLNTLAQADFFLCPPGYVMPMCHNTVEAIAVGAIPIINYPEWFSPSLVDMETCVAFNSESELIEKIQLVLNLGQDRIDEMHEKVISYYQEHLDQASFVKRLELMACERVALLMITDKYVAKNPEKLSSKSVLIAGTPEIPGSIWKRARRALL